MRWDSSRASWARTYSSDLGKVLGDFVTEVVNVKIVGIVSERILNLHHGATHQPSSLEI